MIRVFSPNDKIFTSKGDYISISIKEPASQSATATTTSGSSSK